MELKTPQYRTDYYGETINRLIDGKTQTFFVRPRDNVFIPSGVPSAIILGNGPTRNYPDIQSLLKNNAKKSAGGYKLVYACNRAIHDEESYDYYVVKHPVFLARAKAEKLNQTYLPPEIFMNYTTECNMIPYTSYYDAGAAAAYLACFDGHKKIFLIGFDGDNGSGWKTVYDGTTGYSDGTGTADYSSWADYLHQVMKVYSDVEFYRIQSDGAQSPASWRSLPNFKDVNIRQASLAGDF